MREKYLKSGFGKRYLKNRLKRFLSRTTSLRDKSPTGFTLLELMVVVVIIAITIGGALFYGQGTYRRTSVKNAARDVASTMRLAHSKAMTLREDYYAVYDTTNQIIWVQSYSSYTTSGKSPDSGSEKKLPKVVEIYEVTLGGTTDPHKHHTFTWRGTASGGIVKLRDKNNKVEYRVENLPATAAVKIYSSW